MANAKPEWLKRAEKDILEQVIATLPGTGDYPMPMYGTWESEAVYYLVDLGALSPLAAYRISGQLRMDETTLRN